jgi:hypothetical protein
LGEQTKGDDEVGWTYGVHWEKRNARRALVVTPEKKRDLQDLEDKILKWIIENAMGGRGLE